MSIIKPAFKGLACAVFGAAAMHLFTQHQANAIREESLDTIASDFVVSNVLQAVPGLLVHADTLVDAGKDYLRENSAMLCDAFDRDLCYLDVDAEEGLGLQILDTAFGICDEHPVELEQACRRLVEYAESVLNGAASEEQNETPVDEPPPQQNEATPFFIDPERQPRLMV